MAPITQPRPDHRIVSRDCRVPGGNGPSPSGRAHSCPAPRCNAALGPFRLLCRPDWGRVPWRLRGVAWQAWGVHGPGSAAYRAAVAAILAWLGEASRDAA